MLGRINIEETLGIYSSKTWKDFRQSGLYRNIVDTDPDAIVGKFIKDEYKRAIIYWAAPEYAFAIDLGKDWQSLREKQEAKNKEGYIYLINIGAHLYKYGRTGNVKQRLAQYPKGSTLCKSEFVKDMYEAEKILLNCANESNGKLFHGNEYYYHTDPNEPYDVWDKALSRIN